MVSRQRAAPLILASSARWPPSRRQVAVPRRRGAQDRRTRRTGPSRGAGGFCTGLATASAAAAVRLVVGGAGGCIVFVLDSVRRMRVLRRRDLCEARGSAGSGALCWLTQGGLDVLGGSRAHIRCRGDPPRVLVLPQPCDPGGHTLCKFAPPRISLQIPETLAACGLSAIPPVALYTAPTDGGWRSEEPALELEVSASTSAARAVHHLVPALTHKQPRLEAILISHLCK